MRGSHTRSQAPNPQLELEAAAVVAALPEIVVAAAPNNPEVLGVLRETQRGWLASTKTLPRATRAQYGMTRWTHCRSRRHRPYDGPFHQGLDESEREWYSVLQ